MQRSQLVQSAKRCKNITYTSSVSRASGKASNSTAFAGIYNATKVPQALPLQLVPFLLSHALNLLAKSWQIIST